jgi:hypothetical protein
LAISALIALAIVFSGINGYDAARKSIIASKASPPIPKPDLVPSEANRIAFVKWSQSILTDRSISSSGKSNTMFEIKTPNALKKDTVRDLPRALANAAPELVQGLISVGFRTLATTDATGERHSWSLPSIAADNRRAYARTLEDGMLRKGFNVDVTTAGNGATTLVVKWVLVTKAQAYQLSDDPETMKTWRQLGFKKVELEDGYREDWIITSISSAVVGPFSNRSNPPSPRRA